MKTLRALLLGITMSATWWPMLVESAQPVVVGFDSSAENWVGSSQIGTGSWNFTGGVARLSFSDTFPIFFDSGTLSNLPSASSGSFTGNYDAAGIRAIGFSFLATTAKPSGVVLEIGGVTSVYQRQFSVATTGVWHHFSASLASVQEGGWTNLAGPVGDFASVRQNVRYVTIKIARDASAGPRQYLIDNIFLGREPVAGDVLQPGGSFRLLGEDLQSNLTYYVESSPEVTGTWSVAQSFVATNQTQSINLTNDAHRQFWRMRFP
jgi:hypothetical protein